jgi:hypothetical protein
MPVGLMYPSFHAMSKQIKSNTENPTLNAKARAIWLGFLAFSGLPPRIMKNNPAPKLASMAKKTNAIK